MPPEIERVGDSSLSVAFFGRAPALYFRRVWWICRRAAVALDQPEPAQLGQHIIARATGMAMHDQPARAVHQRERRAAGLVHRADAAVPFAAAVCRRRARRQSVSRSWPRPPRIQKPARGAQYNNGTAGLCRLCRGAADWGKDDCGWLLGTGAGRSRFKGSFSGSCQALLNWRLNIGSNRASSRAPCEPLTHRRHG